MRANVTVSMSMCARMEGKHPHRASHALPSYEHMYKLAMQTQISHT